MMKCRGSAGAEPSCCTEPSSAARGPSSSPRPWKAARSMSQHRQWLPTTCKIKFTFLSLAFKVQATSNFTSETFQLGLLLWVPLPAHHVPRRGLWTRNMPVFEL